MRMYKREVKRRRAEKILRQAGVFFISLTPRLLLTLCSRYFSNVAVRDEHFKTKRHKKRYASFNFASVF